MKILIIGGGGREHAIGSKLKSSNETNNIYFAPGNAGTSKIGENILLDVEDFNSVSRFCKREEMDLVVIGPEQPLVAGLSDYLRQDGILVFGPNRNAAIIEGEKAFAKEFMKKNNIPTADYKIFTNLEYEEAINYLKSSNYPIVIKANGLAAGKGVVICENFEKAQNEVENYLVKSKFGVAGEKIVIEEFLEGKELSVFVITDGNGYLILPPSQDFKRIYNNNLGPNTGGMGAYSPLDFVSDQDIEEIEDEIIVPTLRKLSDDNRTFSGCLYCGLIKTDSGVKVIEYNARFGDPETQAVLELLDGRFDMLLLSAAQGALDKDAVDFLNRFVVNVVVASEGYPNKYEKGKEIFGLNDISSDVKVFHAGTILENGKVLTNGGRVLSVVASADSLEKAKNIVYENLKKIYFDGIYYRTDIPSL